MSFNQHYIRFLILFFGLQFTVNACKIVSNVQIEVMRPAQTSLPLPITKILIVNTWNSQKNFFSENSEQNYNYQRDTLASQIIVQYVAGLLNDSPRLDTVMYVPSMFYRPPGDLLKEIDGPSILRLCSKFNADALLSLDAFSVKNSVDHFNFYDEVGVYHENDLCLVVNSLWRLHDADSQKIVTKFWQHDTLYFPEIANDYQYKEVIKDPNGLNWIAREIANEVSLNSTSKLAPYWQPVDRDSFYTLDAEMQNALQLANQNEWLKAAAIWQKKSEDKHKYIASSACHNMALVCEVQGKLDLALVWAYKAINLQFNELTYNYIFLLKQRIAEEEKLNLQFGLN